MKTYDTVNLTLAQCARELGLSRKKARKALAKLEWIYPPKHGRYDARVLDMIRALHGQPHRTLEPAEADWLARYLKENRDHTEEGSSSGSA